MIISDLDHLNTETRPQVSGGVGAFGFARGTATASGNRVNLATTLSVTLTYAFVVAAPRGH